MKPEELEQIEEAEVVSTKIVNTIDLILEEPTPEVSWTYYPEKPEVLKIIEENKPLFENVLSFLKTKPTCVGIASNQLSLNGKRIDLPFTFSRGKENWHFWLNPKIVKYHGEPIQKIEGCLTWPNHSIEVKRYIKIDVQYIDINGVWKEKTCYDLEAQILQHEIDHLEGIPEKLISKVTSLHVGEKIGRNDQCKCGSGFKYKKCCGK